MVGQNIGNIVSKQIYSQMVKSLFRVDGPEVL